MLRIMTRELFSVLLLKTLNRLFSSENGLALCMVTPQGGSYNNTGQPQSGDKDNQRSIQRMGGGGVSQSKPTYDSSAASKGGASSIGRGVEKKNGGGFGSTPRNQVGAGASNKKSGGKQSNKDLMKKNIAHLNDYIANYSYDTRNTKYELENFNLGKLSPWSLGLIESKTARDKYIEYEKKLREFLITLGDIIDKNVLNATKELTPTDIADIIKKIKSDLPNNNDYALLVNTSIRDFIDLGKNASKEPPLDTNKYKFKNDKNKKMGLLLIRTKNMIDRYRELVHRKVETFKDEKFVNSVNEEVAKREKNKNETENPPK